MKKLFIYIITIILLPLSFCNAEDMIVDGFSPVSGKVGDTVMITGENFSGVNRVSFTSSTSSDLYSVIYSVNGTSLTTVVPEGARTGKIKIEVKDASGIRTLLTPTDFKVEGVPITESKKISFDFNPDNGSVGTEVILSTNDSFGAVDKVYFGGVSVIPIINNENFIQVLVPEGAKTGRILIKTDSSDIESLTDFVVTGSIGVNPPIQDDDPKPASDSNYEPVEYTHSTIEFDGIVPRCNKGEIDDETGDYKNDCDFEDVMALVNKFINFLLIKLATPIFAIIIMYVGFTYLTAGGDSGKISKVKGIFQNAILGYVLALAAWLIVKTILTTLGYIDVGTWF